MATSGFDPGCVKTCAHEKRAELFSLLSCPGNRRQRFCFSNRLKSRRNFRSQIQFWSFHAAKTQLGHRFVQAATACRTADLRNFSALGVKQQPLTRPARLMVMRAAVSHSSIEIPAANTAIARCSAGFRSAHEILFIACPRDGFRLFFELLPYNYSHTVSDSLSVENDRLVTLHGLFRAVEPHKGIFLSTVALPCLNPSSHL